MGRLNQLVINGFGLLLVPKRFKGYDPGGEEFIHEFESKYPKLLKPKFCNGKIEEMLEEATIKNMPLFVYFHSDTDADAANFIKNTISNKDAVAIIVYHSHITIV